ncbi:hypothetical protein NA57DRAFT_79190 [Rhizodiscina lignyota]|uniref:Uncharacterized protein n=1 Tax=Rhizodiscina lignyota TaxID=1504668 RepID=A0A9P4I5D3_9PEZI|nr:hypothetical protein NA57DRAFT_79190 [Rhizodiscina lignyota]
MRVEYTSVFLLFGSLAAAGQWKKVKHIDQSYLLVRDGYCQGSCASCFGAGNIICQGIMCYNPSTGEQCCADGTYCDGTDTSCCGSIGAGEGYDDSDGGDSSGSGSATDTVATPTATDDSFVTSTDSSSSSSPSYWSCDSDDTPEQCCAHAGSDSKWCYGDGFLADITCYRPSKGEECCADGYTCEGKGCCSDAGETAVTPTPTSFTPLSTDDSNTFTDFTGDFNTATDGSFNLSGPATATTRSLLNGGDATPTSSPSSGDSSSGSDGSSGSDSSSGSGSGSGSGDSGNAQSSSPLAGVAGASEGSNVKPFAAAAICLLGLIMLL